MNQCIIYFNLIRIFEILIKTLEEHFNEFLDFKKNSQNFIMNYLNFFIKIGFFKNEKINNLLNDPEIYMEMNQIKLNLVYNEIKERLNTEKLFMKKRYFLNEKDIYLKKNLSNDYNYNKIENYNKNLEEKIKEIFDIYINEKNNFNKTKIFSFSINIIRISEIYNLLKESNDKKNYLLDYNFQLENIKKDLFTLIIENFNIFALNIFIIYNNINYKIYVKNLKQNRNNYNIMDIYTKIHEESHNYLARYSFENLDEIINDYYQLEKENTFSFIDKRGIVSIIATFFDYNPQRKDEFHNLEVIFIKNDLMLLSKEYSNFIENFFIHNEILWDLLSEYGINLINQDEFLKKIKSNNPFYEHIIRNFFINNNIDMKYNNKSLTYVK
jgi:hypothetical protein